MRRHRDYESCYGLCHGVEPTEATDETAADKETNDRVEISENDKAAITEQILSGEIGIRVQNAVTKIYSSSGKTQPLKQPQPVVMDVKI